MRISQLPLLLAALPLWLVPPAVQAADEAPYGLEQHVPWTSSRVVGSPEPPAPFLVEKSFTKLKLVTPIFIIAEPGSESLIAVQQGGEKGKPSKVFRVPDDPDTAQMDPFLEMNGRLIYSLTFHPGYKTNGYIYVFSNGPTPDSERTNRISRFTVSREAPRACDPQSEHTIIEWHSQGHDGGGIVFGHDGMLYISSGDGTSDSDGWNTGQDVSDLNGGVLRIDVDHPDAGRAYSVPRDNPFIGMKDARPELWAFGLRNPWRMCIDDVSGRIWVGVNGQDLWETAHLLRRGENYGWSVYEGSHPFYLNRKLGPTPPVAPTIEHHHAEFRSLTGGVVYHGEKFPELNGVYVYGDYSTGEIWGALHDGHQLLWDKQLAQSQLQITAFANDHHGNLLVLDHVNGIHLLVRRPPDDSARKFPRRLSETGIFLSTKEHRLDPGIIPYSVNAPAWTDNARVERFIGLPGDVQIKHSSATWDLPEKSVLVQTFFRSGEHAEDPASTRIETRLLTKQNGQWTGYSYRWNEDQSDASLVDAKGAESQVAMKDSAGHDQQQTWRFPARAECMACHSRAANFVLGLTDLQMNKTHAYSGVADNQIRALSHIGLFSGAAPKVSDTAPKLVNPYDPAAALEQRARSYLHVNCSVCHVEAGGGNSKMELGFGRSHDKMNLIGARPQHDSFGIDNAMLISPGDPARSVLLQRLSRRGRGQMPPLVSNAVDEKAVTLFREWISSMQPEQKFVRDWKMSDLEPLLSQVKQGRSFENGRKIFTQTGCVQCHRFAGDGGSVGPDLTGVSKRLPLHDILESMILPSKVIAEGFATTDIETNSGESFSGRIEREDDSIVVLRPVAGEPIKIAKKDILRRSLSRISNMPTGIVNTLTQAEILDLLAFLVADGQSDHAAFH